MKRKSFISKSILGLASLSLIPETLSAKPTSTASMLDLNERVGFNHIPNKEIRTMKSVLHKSETRGLANHGWLESKHTFSFANYHNPERMNFGVLRVLNDDKVAGGQGFGTHPHRNMEIISIPIEGDLEHKDSMGNHGIIQEGDVQVMSAGTGIRHSEYNKNTNQEVKFLQIWVIPNQNEVTPRYDQIKLDHSKTMNQWHQILSPNANDEGVWIHQNAWFHLGELDQNKQVDYTLKDPNNGVYAFILSGDIELNGQELNSRDGYGVWDTNQLTITAKSKAKVLLMEVPMS